MSATTTMISISVKPLSRARCDMRWPPMVDGGRPRAGSPLRGCHRLSTGPDLRVRRPDPASRLHGAKKFQARAKAGASPDRRSPRQQRKDPRQAGAEPRDSDAPPDLPQENTNARSHAEVHEGEGPGLHPDRAPRRHHHHRHPRRHRHPGLPQPAQEGRRRLDQVRPQERRHSSRDLDDRQPLDRHPAATCDSAAAAAPPLGASLGFKTSPGNTVSVKPGAGRHRHLLHRRVQPGASSQRGHQATSVYTSDGGGLHSRPRRPRPPADPTASAASRVGSPSSRDCPLVVSRLARALGSGRAWAS